MMPSLVVNKGLKADFEFKYGICRNTCTNIDKTDFPIIMRGVPRRSTLV
jgi:hypothetical protein